MKETFVNRNSKMWRFRKTSLTANVPNSCRLQNGLGVKLCGTKTMLLCSRGEEERAGGGGRNLQARFSFYSLLNAHPFQASVTCRQCSFCSTYAINTSKTLALFWSGLLFLSFCFVLFWILFCFLDLGFLVLLWFWGGFFCLVGFWWGGRVCLFFKLRFQMGRSSCGL